MSASIILVTAFVAANAAVYLHARAMTHFVGPSDASPPLDAMSTWQRAAVFLIGVRLAKPVNTRTPADVGLPFTTHMIPGNPALQAWLLPHERARGLVVMLHGYGAAKASLLDVARGFADLGWATLLVDLRGAGGSGGQDTSIGVHEAVDVARASAFAATLAVPGPQVFYGFSMGAVAVLRAASLGLIKPDAAILGAPFDRLRTTVANRFGAMGLPAWPAADAMVFWGSVQQGFWGQDHDPVVYARDVDFAVLQLHGDQDWRVTPTEARSVYDALAGPKTWHLFAGLGHCLYGAVRPAEWRTVVGPFLADIKQRPSPR